MTMAPPLAGTGKRFWKKMRTNWWARNRRTRAAPRPTAMPTSSSGVSFSSARKQVSPMLCHVVVVVPCGGGVG